MHLSMFPLSDLAVSVDFGEKVDKVVNNSVHEAARKLNKHPFNGFIESVPTFNSLTVYYNPSIAGTFPQVCEKIKQSLLDDLSEESHNQIIHRIPVCYDGAHAPDLPYLSAKLNLSESEIIDIHTKPIYDVYFLGFSAGFPFLGGLSKKLNFPRKPSPRLKVPAGSVGIAGSQTGIYPIETPGGWQIIGRTPLRLFNPENIPPVWIKPGDKVHFFPIPIQEFLKLEAQNGN